MNKSIEGIIDSGIQIIFKEVGKLDRGICDNITGNPIKDYYICRDKVIKNTIKSMVDDLKDKYRSRIKNLKETRQAWQCIANRRRDYANHLSEVLRDKNKRLKELSDLKKQYKVVYRDPDGNYKVIEPIREL